VNRGWRLSLIGFVFLLTACGQQRADTPPPAPPKVTVSQPVVREVVEWDEYSGRLKTVESVEVRARVNGYLQSIHFTDGAIVKKGALLFVIDPRPYQAELNRAKAQLEQAIARFERTQKDFARAQQLVKSRAMSQEEVDTRGADQTQRFVFVVNDQYTVEYRKVELGPMIDGLRVIRDGLKPEDWMIVNPCGQKTQTHYFLGDYGSTISRFSSCIPSRYTPYAPPTSGNSGGGVTHELEAAAGVDHGLCR
jgi:multidrug efflux pump subunit AcrA (membrane-fusion protein)